MVCFPLSQVWEPVAGTGCVSVAPQTVQVRCETPSDPQVGEVIVVHDDQVWIPVAGMPSMVVAPQILQVSSLIPLLMQVGEVIADSYQL